MAGVFHISETEAARDLSAVVDRALAGEEVVLRRGGRDVAVLSAVDPMHEAMRPLGEILDELKRTKLAKGLARVDDEFASDMRKARGELNVPLDAAKWE